MKIKTEQQFNLTQYWSGDSVWSKDVLPNLVDAICKSPVVNRILIIGEVGVGKSRLARLIAAYSRYVKSPEEERKLLLQAYKKGHPENPHVGIPEDAIPHFSAINIATLPTDTGMATLFGIAPNYYMGTDGTPGIFESVMYKDKKNSFYDDYYNKSGKTKQHPDEVNDGEKDVTTGGIVFFRRNS